MLLLVLYDLVSMCNCDYTGQFAVCYCDFVITHKWYNESTCFIVMENAENNDNVKMCISQVFTALHTFNHFYCTMDAQKMGY